MKRALRSAAGAKVELISRAPFSPQLCIERRQAPSGDAWIHECKFDGWRLMGVQADNQVTLWSRNGVDLTNRAPEIVGALQALGLSSAQLDGELLAVRNGREDFSELQRLMRSSSRRREKNAPLVYMVFDIIHLNGWSLRDVALIERKRILREVVGLTKGPGVSQLQFSDHFVGNGQEVLEQILSLGYEGIVSKRADSKYRGGRTGSWVRIKGRHHHRHTDAEADAFKV